MRRKYFTILLFFSFLSTLQTQSLYYPPLTGDTWATVNPQELGWCPESIDTLIRFAEANDSKSLIILKDGRIALERYFGTYTRDSVWYWASAGKSLAAFLVGAAQEDEYLQIQDSTAAYLGEGWTNCPPEEENRIRIIHQITMTTGLEDQLEDLGGNVFCLEPECLQCLTEPGTRWAYHNAPYRLVLDVLESATGLDINVFTRLRLGNQIGMRGGWFNYVYYSKARDMARFGLLVLGKGVWNGKAILADTAYFNQMLRPSQQLNPSYGYLWWLNGQDSYKLPGLQFDFPGPLVPEAPADMAAALGLNDQKIYVVPSEGLVVVRQGDSAGGVRPAASSFDNELWKRIADLKCGTVSTAPPPFSLPIDLFPNPSSGAATIRMPDPIEHLILWDSRGRRLRELSPHSREIQLDLTGLPKGIYLLQVRTKNGAGRGRMVKE